MRRRPKLISLPAFLVLAGLLLGTIGGAVDSQAALAQAEDVSPLTQCLNENQSLSVLFLVDTSQSLKRTDPEAQRVEGLRSAYQTLAAIATRPTSEGGEAPEVFIEFADFGTTTRRSFPDRAAWAPADDERDLRRIEEFAARDQSEDTDYVGALEPWVNRTDRSRPDGELGALELLEQAPAGSCRSVIWFTDGQFDIDYQGKAKQVHWVDPPFDVVSEEVEAQAEKVGVDRLCGRGDLADRLRTGPITEGSGAYVTVVALGDPENFDLIRRVVEDAGAEPCGSEIPRGEVLGVDSLGELIYRLTEGANPERSVLPDGTIPTCAAAMDDEESSTCELSFALAPTIRAFNLLTLAGDPAVSTSLIAPDGEVVLFSGSTVVPLASGALLKIEQLGSDGDVFRVEGVLDEDGVWAGRWRLRFESADEALVREAVNRASMYLFFRSLKATLPNPGAPLRVGRSRTLTVQLTNPSDEPASDEAFVDGSEIDVFVDDKAVIVSPIAPDGSFTFKISLPEDSPTNDLVVRAELRPIVRVTDDAPVIELPPWSGVLATLKVEPLPKRPIIEPFETIKVALDQENRSVKTKALVDARAKDAGGCVRLIYADAPVIGGLNDLGSVTFSFKGEVVDAGTDCPIRLADGEFGFIELELSIENVELDKAEHFVNGTVLFETKGAIEPVQAGEEPLAYQAVIKPKIIDTTDWKKVALFSLLSLLVPILLLMIANWVAAKLRTDRSAHVSLDVALVDGRLIRIDEGGDRIASVDADDLQIIGNPPEGSQREVSVAGFDFRARMPINPFGDVSATVSRPGSPTVVGDLGVAKSGRGRTPVVMSRAWAFAANGTPVKSSPGADTLERVTGRLVVVCPPLHTAAVPFINGRMAEISGTVERSLLRVAVDPEPEQVMPPDEPDRPLPGGGRLPGEGGSAGLRPGPGLFEGDSDIEKPRLDPFGNPIASPSVSAAEANPAKSKREKRERRKKKKSQETPPPPASDRPPQPF